MNYVESGNNIVCDGWFRYAFLDTLDGWMGIHEMCIYVHIYEDGDFGLGLNSTSHIDSIWSQLKSILKYICYVIPHQIFDLFLSEA